MALAALASSLCGDVGTLGRRPETPRPNTADSTFRPAPRKLMAATVARRDRRRRDTLVALERRANGRGQMRLHCVKRFHAGQGRRCFGRTPGGLFSVPHGPQARGLSGVTAFTRIGSTVPHNFIRRYDTTWAS